MRGIEKKEILNFQSEAELKTKIKIKTTPANRGSVHAALGKRQARGEVKTED